METEAFKEKAMRWFIKIQFGGAVRARVYRKLISFLKNGVPLSSALKIMWTHATDDGKNPNHPTALVLRDWMDRVANGQSFGRAVTGWVPDSDRIVLEAGETAGALDEAIANALYIHEGGKKIKGAIIGGLAYPAILILVALGFMIMFGVKIVPSFDAVLPKEKWMGTAANMAMVADFVDVWLLPLGIGLGGLTAAIIWSMPRWTGPNRAFMDRFPPWSLYRLNAGAGFMLSVAALVKAGVQVPEVLRIIGKGASPWYQERVMGALRHVSNGINLGEALYRTKLNFPDAETVKDLRSYAELDGFEETLEVLGRQWMEESVDKIRAQTGVLRNLAFVILGITFGIIATGIFALEQQVTQSL
jgi:type II secretory pathway component PulF